MPDELLITKLVDSIQQAYDNERAFLASLSEAERLAAGQPDRWSAKDLLAHITAWKGRTGGLLQAALRGEVPPTFGDEAALNAETFEANRERPWSEVGGDAERVVAELLAHVRELSEDALIQPDYFAWRNGRSLWQSVAGNAISHPQAHLAEWYVRRGDLARATQLQEWLAETLSSLDDSPRGRGVASYNLACFYATSGQREKALQILPGALQLNPDLIEWSKQDADLDPLRGEAAFQALYNTPQTTTN